MNGLIQTISPEQPLLQLIHELNQPLTVIKAYLGGCDLRLKNNELSSDQMVNTLQKIMEHTDVLANKVYGMQKIITQDDSSISHLITEITSLFTFELNLYDIQLKLELLENNLSDFCMNKSQFKHIMFCLLKLCIDTVEKNGIPKAKLAIQAKILKKYTLNMTIKSNFPIEKDNLEKKLTYCRSLLFEDCVTIDTQFLSHGISISLSIFHKDSRYAI
ncbi:hypothetical protein [Legionella cincinnatiensis]|uniref:histidine kinase n=1 Tax=Legionella cincinnatiensis TaxID=28085 RepID=A0A378ING2_9GAMM|nr:hypothetical protein [Legionella cincinnatiensis]KTC93416.1 hypothetical protein Lcin_0454 [Legionella cincinnatiensis]STX36583.1 Signal transduction histidine kinase, nitrogen specific [Legionella cincinnatiensis]